MNQFKKVFSLQQANETKVVYEKSKSESENKEDKKEGEEETVTVSELKIDESQESIRSSSQNSWWNTWSGLSTQFNSSQKRELCDNKEDEKGWSSFCSKETKNELLFSSHANKEDSSQAVTTQPENIPAQTCVDKGDNVKEDDEGKVEFFLRVGKHKKFKYF